MCSSLHVQYVPIWCACCQLQILGYQKFLAVSSREAFSLLPSTDYTEYLIFFCSYCSRDLVLLSKDVSGDGAQLWSAADLLGSFGSPKFTPLKLPHLHLFALSSLSFAWFYCLSLWKSSHRSKTVLTNFYRWGPRSSWEQAGSHLTHPWLGPRPSVCQRFKGHSMSPICGTSNFAVHSEVSGDIFKLILTLWGLSWILEKLKKVSIYSMFFCKYVQYRPKV